MRRHSRFGGASWLLALLLAHVASAQVVERPSDERLPAPEFESPPSPPPRLLPPLPPPPERFSGAIRLYVEAYRIVGSTVFSDAQLQEVVAPYTGREIGSEDLVAINRALTDLYLAHGYLNSGADIPDQDPTDAVVEIQIIEGWLSGFRFEGNEYYTDRVLRWRLEPGTRAPLQEGRIEERLRLLQQDPRIAAVRARLVPGEERGEGILIVAIEERSPYKGWLEASNYATVGVGAYRGRVRAAHENLMGFGDVLNGRFDVADGLRRVRGRYDFPFTPAGTRLRLEANYSESRVVENEFEALDIEAEFQGYEIGLVQPILVTPELRLGGGILGAWRRSRTFQAGEPTTFVLGADRGRSQVTVLRFLLEGSYRSRSQVFAARSLLSQGLDALGANSNPSGIPDGVFTSWLAQLQWAGRLDPWGIEAIVRGDLQLASDPLLTIEQFAVGGHATVRGYRENQIVRDQGVIGSIEFRVPVWRRADVDSVLQLAPFLDAGYAWNRTGVQRDRNPKTLVGTGVGLRLALGSFAATEIYWGANLTESLGSGDLQDHGVQFRIAFGFF